MLKQRHTPKRQRSQRQASTPSRGRKPRQKPRQKLNLRLNFHLLVRAYDNGVAFRYAVPEQAGVSAIKVRSEGTQFNFAKDYDCWGANMGRFDTSFEAKAKADEKAVEAEPAAPVVAK